MSGHLSKLSLNERLAARVIVTANDCHEWTGAVNSRGYGQMRVAHKAVYTHRLAWELANGVIPNGFWVLHHCDNPPCCNPSHLFLGTQADNMADMVAKGRHVSSWAAKTHCPQGHPYDHANTYVSPEGWRGCRACGRSKRARAQHAAQVSQWAPVAAVRMPFEREAS